MAWVGINAVEPPYRIHIRGTSNLPKDIHDQIEMLKEDLSQAHAEFRRTRGSGLEVYLDSDS
jgi:hypothetical protein